MASWHLLHLWGAGWVPELELIVEHGLGCTWWVPAKLRAHALSFWRAGDPYPLPVVPNITFSTQGSYLAFPTFCHLSPNRLIADQQLNERSRSKRFQDFAAHNPCLSSLQIPQSSAWFYKDFTVVKPVLQSKTSRIAHWAPPLPAWTPCRISYITPTLNLSLLIHFRHFYFHYLVFIWTLWKNVEKTKFQFGTWWLVCRPPRNWLNEWPGKFVPWSFQKKRQRRRQVSPHSEWWSLFCGDKVVNVLLLWWIKAVGQEAAEWSWRGPAFAFQLNNSGQALPFPWASGFLSLIGQGWIPRALPHLPFVISASSQWGSPGCQRICAILLKSQSSVMRWEPKLHAFYKWRNWASCQGQDLAVLPPEQDPMSHGLYPHSGPVVNNLAVHLESARELWKNLDAWAPPPMTSKQSICGERAWESGCF